MTDRSVICYASFMPTIPKSTGLIAYANGSHISVTNHGAANGKERQR